MGAGLGIGLGLICYVCTLVAVYSSRNAFEDEVRMPRWLIRLVGLLLPVLPFLAAALSPAMGRDCSNGACAVDGFVGIF